MKTSISHTIVCSLLFFISCTSDTEKNIAQENKKGSLRSLFALMDSTQIIGTKKNPIFSVYRLTVKDSSYYLIDRKNYTILRYNFDGNFINKWGKKGRGPREFLNPVWIGTTKDNIYIIDSGGNLRLQIFTSAGKIINSFPLRSSGPFLQSNFIESGSDILFMTTTVVNCGKNERKECVMQIQDQNGTVIRQFATIEEVAPNSIGLPFHSSFLANKEKIYVAHVHGKKMLTYSLKGEKLAEYPLDRSPAVQPLDMTTMPEDVYKQAREMRNRSYTYIGEMYAWDNKIFIQYYRSNKKSDPTQPEAFIDIYNEEGELIHYGIDTKYRLFEVKKGFFYFLKKNENLSQPKYKIYKYEYDPEK